MVGSRKQKAFYLAQGMLFLISLIAIFRVPSADVGAVFQWFSIATMALAGGFFGFNGAEHLANAWPKAAAAKAQQASNG